ncbi:MAG: molybdate ABC transporter substrate-binding protein [Betaproteobacteria bacterium]|nr:molybdate ABC transporter substrate-binding protein [Betaproteobacteria bacterium]
MPFPRLFALALAFAAAAVPVPALATPPAIAAAADLQFALAELADRYRSATGREVRLAYGSSGNFAQQIANGAPFELFLSADEFYVEHLAARGLARDAGTLYGIGRVVLFVPARSPLKADATLADLRAAVADGRVRRFAIANPEHAPYGRAARDVLQSAGLWEPLRGALVLGENASQAMQFAAGGNAQGGIVPLSLARAPEIAKLGSAALLPESLHKPLRQRMVLLKRAGPQAADFYRWLQTPPAREVFARHGFALPGEN